VTTAVADAEAGPTDRPDVADGGPGRLTIADRVVEKIASQAANEVDRATGAPRRVLGVHVGGDDRAPQVDAHVDGGVATVSIVMSVAWPAPVRDVTRRVRDRVTERLAELAGITRAQVDIRVSALSAETTTERRVD
jgi:uncharacterized alkaline shock family protein YloU